MTLFSRRNFYYSFSIFLLLIASFISHAADQASVFEAKLIATDQSGKKVAFENSSGKWQLVAFIYTDCTSLCPIIIADLKNLDAQLSKTQKKNSVIQLITLNPDVDTPEQLNHFKKEHLPKDKRWQLLQFDNEQLQLAAMLFNIRYKKIDTEIAHSRTISLLDPQGHLVYQSQGNEGIEHFKALIKD